MRIENHLKITIKAIITIKTITTITTITVQTVHTHNEVPPIYWTVLSPK